jgi:membrane-bound lytic murein transglycosylase MltF
MIDIYGYLRAWIAANKVQPLIIEDEDPPKSPINKSTKLIERPNIEIPPDTSDIRNKEVSWMNFDDNGFKNALLDAQVQTESNGKTDAVSHKGAMGIAQFMPGTWEDAKKKGWIPKDADRRDPVASLKAQKELMNELYNLPIMVDSETEEERIAKTLAAYNAGYGRLKEVMIKASTKGGNWFDYLPEETKKYVPIIIKRTKQEYFKNEGNYVPKYERE